MDLVSLAVLPQFVVTSAMLESDGVHLNPTSGDLFLGHLCQNVQASINSPSEVTLVEEIVSSSESDEEEVDAASVGDDDRLGAILKIVKSNSKRLRSVKPLRDTLTKLDERTTAFETQVRLRRQRDNLVFARIKEESDWELNKSRENRVVISGLERVSRGSTSHQEKKDHYLKVLIGLVSKACPDLDPQPVISDVIVSLQRNQASPSIEARFDSVSNAFAFRKAASTLAKAQSPDFGKLYFSNSVTQATRVRIEIMKAIAKKLTTLTEEAYVQGFISRPLLRYLARDPSVNLCAGTGRSYTFVNAVSRYGDLVHSHELVSAYKRAGSTFQGAMEQYFVLLKEAEDIPVQSGSNRAPIGPHRGRGGPFRGLDVGRRGRKRLGGGTPPGTPFKKKPNA